jgi:hypothetical protein
MDRDDLWIVAHFSELVTIYPTVPFASIYFRAFALIAAIVSPFGSTSFRPEAPGDSKQ